MEVELDSFTAYAIQMPFSFLFYIEVRSDLHVISSETFKRITLVYYSKKKIRH